MRTLLIALCVGAASSVNGDDYGSYPEQYPLDKDLLTALELPDTGMPEFTFDDADTGGYYLYGAIKQTMDNQDGPAFYSMGNSLDYFWFPEHLGKGLWDMNLIKSPLSSWNCTAAGNFFGKSNFPGTQNGETICTDCCSEYIGNAMFGSDTEVRQQLFADFVATNGCSTMTEEIYCVTGDSWHWICLEGYITREERLIMKPCLDGFAIQMAQCSLLKSTGVHSYLEGIFAEPKSYIDLLSNENSFALYSLEYSTFDKVCMPYSYYHAEGNDADSSGVNHVLALTSSAFVVAATLF